jgi:DsbC/DsbD-like thiol-disulfide interchange protein
MVRDETSPHRFCLKWPRRIFLTALLAFLAGAFAAQAEETASAGERLRLLAASHVDGEMPILAGIEMKLAPGWHTYWRYPGASGIAPRFDWKGSRNVASVDLRWPAPRQFDEGGDATFGYEGEVIWPLLVRAADPTKPVVLHVVISYGVCLKICVPGEAQLSRTIEVGENTSPEEGESIRRFLARVPAPPKDPRTVTMRFAQGTKPYLDVQLKDASETPTLIVEGPDDVWFGTPEIAGAGGTVDYKVPIELAPGATLKGAELTLTFSGPSTAIEARRSVR